MPPLTPAHLTLVVVVLLATLLVAPDPAGAGDAVQQRDYRADDPSSRLYRRTACLTAIQRAILTAYEPFLDGFEGNVAILDVSVAHNLGDNILWLGAKRILAQHERTPEVVCAATMVHKAQVPPTGFMPLCPKPDELLRQLGPQVGAWVSRARRRFRWFVGAPWGLGVGRPRVHAPWVWGMCHPVTRRAGEVVHFGAHTAQWHYRPGWEVERRKAAESSRACNTAGPAVVPHAHRNGVALHTTSYRCRHAPSMQRRLPSALTWPSQ